MRSLLSVLLKTAIRFVQEEVLQKPGKLQLEKAEALMRVADLHLARFNKSREIEWQANALLWTAVLASGGFLLAQRPWAGVLAASVAAAGYAAYLPAALIAGGHYAWLWKIQKSQDRDKRSYLRCRDQALECVGSLEKIGRAEESFEGACGCFWTFSAAAVTFILGATVTYFCLFAGSIGSAASDSPPVASIAQAAAAPFIESDFQCVLRLSPAESLLGSAAFDLNRTLNY